MLAEIAAEKNSQPLPQIRQNYGLRLPNDRFCQLQPNYEHLSEQSTSSNNAEIRQVPIKNNLINLKFILANSTKSTKETAIAKFQSRNCLQFINGSIG